MKAVFFGTEVLERVYTPKTRKRLEYSGVDLSSLPLEAGGADGEMIFTSWGMPSYPLEEIRERFPRLEYLFYGAGSVKSFARPFLQSGVRVFSAWAANAVPVAEFTVAQIILCGKRYFDVFTGVKHPAPGTYGLKVGIIGLGMIGAMVAERLRAYDTEVYVYDAFKTENEIERLGAKKAELDFIFANCDVISNHLANNEATRNMITSKLLMSMKEDSAFINTGRGAQVDHMGLYNAMAERPKALALLDVTEPEPLPGDHPLRSLKNVIISPHIAGSLGGEVARMGEYMVDECERVIKGNAPLYEVTEEMLRYMA